MKILLFEEGQIRQKCINNLQMKSFQSMFCHSLSIQNITTFHKQNNKRANFAYYSINT